MSRRGLDPSAEEAQWTRCQEPPARLGDALVELLEARLSPRDPLWSVIAGQAGVTLPA